VTLLWFVASFLGILLSLGSATLAFYRVMASLSQPKKQTYIFTTFMTEFKQKIVKRMLFTMLFFVNILGIFVLFQWAIVENMTFLLVILIFLVYEFSMGIMYYLGLNALFSLDPDQSLLSIVFIAMHQNLWRNLQLISPVLIMVFAFFYVHPASVIFLLSAVIWLQLVILKKAFLKTDQLNDEE
jgi:uncharacterized membrane protein YesL